MIAFVSTRVHVNTIIVNITQNTNRFIVETQNELINATQQRYTVTAYTHTPVV
jgi:hypothetical protein